MLAVEALTEGLSAAQALTGPTVDGGETLRDRHEGDAVTRDDAQAAAEDAISGNSVVIDETCVMYAWSAGLEVSGTVTFTDCVLEATGETIDGTATLRVGLAPTSFAFEFSALTIGDLTLDGSVAILFGGGCPSGTGRDTCENCRDNDPACQEMRVDQRTLTADLTMTISGEALEVVLDELTLTTDATGTTINGMGTVTEQGQSSSITATAVHFDPGGCLPVSGTLALSGGTPFEGTITFLATTPEDGAVQVEGIPIPLALFTPCMAAP
jgi:hypothetical protein